MIDYAKYEWHTPCPCELAELHSKCTACMGNLSEQHGKELEAKDKRIQELENKLARLRACAEKYTDPGYAYGYKAAAREILEIIGEEK